MNAQMAYLLGMILGNGELQRGNKSTIVTIEIPHKNLRDDAGLDVGIYVKASITDIRNVIEPLLGNSLSVTQSRNSTKMSFEKSNEGYTMREILRFVGNGTSHSTMKMNSELFSLTTEEKKQFLRGFADVTGYIRDSNRAYGQPGLHRVYLEIPSNWDMVIDIVNMLKDLDIPVQTIDFAHPNFRDPKITKYREGKLNYWKKEHQIKIWANEFIPVGFNIAHKQRALTQYSNELMQYKTQEQTHLFYWERAIRRRKKPIHPAESDESLPAKIQGKHFESWMDLANELGYHK